MPFTNESEQFGSVQNLINRERNVALRNVVLIQTLHEAAVFLYNDRKKMGIRYTLCEHLQSFYIFPNPLCRIVCNSYDILRIKIKADPSDPGSAACIYLYFGLISV